MSGELSLRMETTRDELPRVDAEIEALARREDWSARLEYQVKLVVEELAINMINHGGAREPAEITLVSDEARVTIEITDDGRAFDPLTETAPPAVDSAIGDRPVGGLGVHLVKTMMDEARYRREGGRNRLTLVKRRAE